MTPAEVAEVVARWAGDDAVTVTLERPPRRLAPENGWECWAQGRKLILTLEVER